MRTPKIEALYRMISWCNLNYNSNINLLPLDYSLINSNSWLSGYIDADGTFFLNWLFDKKGSPTMPLGLTILYENIPATRLS